MNILKKKSGFSLIELVVSISIIAIISAIMIANYRSGGNSNELSVAAQNLVSEIRKAQAYSLSHREHNGTIYPTGGWGVRLTDDTSGDLNKNFIFYYDIPDIGPPLRTQKFDQAIEKSYSSQIGHNVFVSNIICDGVDTNAYFWVVFEPPEPKINFLRSSDPSNTTLTEGINTVEIVLEHSSGKTKSIILNKFGLIDIN
ncbi:hypothetical protein C0584_01605 [Candidatus Parcubacteria bacterium]|nr:MAG: hypothetical protein C0584_01605 [Candidatus Parcubacteria bacterium]